MSQCCPCNQNTDVAMNDQTASMQVVPCNTNMAGMNCACSMNGVYIFAILILAGIAAQIFIQAKLLKAIRKK